MAHRAHPDALRTDLRKEGRWETIREGFDALVARLELAKSPLLDVLPPPVQRELVAPWLASITNERSALVAQAKRALVEVARALRDDAHELTDRMLYALLTTAGCGNGIKAQHLTDAVLAIAAAVRSPALLAEALRASRNHPSNKDVQIACIRALNVVLGTWPDEVLLARVLATST